MIIDDMKTQIEIDSPLVEGAVAFRANQLTAQTLRADRPATIIIFGVPTARQLASSRDAVVIEPTPSIGLH